MSANIILRRLLSFMAVLTTVPRRRGVILASMKSGRLGPHWWKTLAIQHMVTGLLSGIEQIAIGVVFVLLTPRVPPAVEYLATQQMAAHPP